MTIVECPKGWHAYGNTFWADRRERHFLCRVGKCRRNVMYAHEDHNHDKDCPFLVARNEARVARAAALLAAYKAHDWDNVSPWALDVAAHGLGIKV